MRQHLQPAIARMLMLFGQAAPLPPLHVFGSRSSWWVPSRVDSRRRRRRLLGRRGLPSGAGPGTLARRCHWGRGGTARGLGPAGGVKTSLHGLTGALFLEHVGSQPRLCFVLMTVGECNSTASIVRRRRIIGSCSVRYTWTCSPVILGCLALPRQPRTPTLELSLHVQSGLQLCKDAIIQD